MSGSAKRWARAACGGLVGAALVLAGCGDDGDDDSSTAADEAPSVSLEGNVDDHGTADLGDATTLTLELDDQYFEPTFVRAPGGVTVTITLDNRGDVSHTFTVDELGIDEQVAPGDAATVDVMLPDAGQLAFYCRLHVAAGMQGAFVVSGEVEPERPALTAPAGGVPGY